MKRNNWVWMPHAGHFICRDRCKFRMNTYVGGYIVSTVGELWGEHASRKIHAHVHDPKWLAENIHLKGDTFDSAYMKRFGYDDLGCDRKYETMVFKAGKSNNKCCPYKIDNGDDLDFKGYNKPEDAMKGHYWLCEKWSKKGKSKK